MGKVIALVVLVVGIMVWLQVRSCNRKADTPPPNEMSSEQIESAFFSTNSIDSVER